MEHHVEMDKKAASINAASEEQDTASQDPEVAAF
jgi:hypothetical protein